MNARAFEPERGAEYSVNDDGSITYFAEPTAELRQRAEAEAAGLRREASELAAPESTPAGADSDEDVEDDDAQLD